MRHRKLPSSRRTQGRAVRSLRRLPTPMDASTIAAILPHMRRAMRACGFWKGARSWHGGAS